MSVKAGGKALVILAIVGTLAATGNWAYDNGYFGTKATVASTIPGKIDLPSTGPTTSALPKSQVEMSKADGSRVKVLTLAWNATLGLMEANGGVITKAGSRMDKRGVTVELIREDDYGKMLAQQVQFAQDVKAGKANPEGAAFVIIMGDGYPAYVAGAQEVLKKLGQQLSGFVALGYSRGEDKCMLPAIAKVDPQKARGSLIGAVLRDGDAHLCFKWASDNGIPINPNEKTYDPDAMNFVSVSTFTEADEKLIAGYCEERPVVQGGKLTREKRRVCQNGTATWTPGDVNIARKIGGVVAVASTKEYMWQMPALVIGNKQWMTQNSKTVTNFIAAALEGGEAVKSDDAALSRGAEIAALVFKEENGAYWKKYYKGVTEQDKTGQLVSLGGSITNGLGDNAFLFGLQGNDNLFKRVYNVFGQLDKQYYPDVMPSIVPYDQVVDTSYLRTVLDSSKTVSVADKPKYVENAPVTGTFAKKAYAIEFDTGKATLTSSGSQVLENLLNQLAVSGLEVQINGHTDNTGNATSNVELSKARAETVKSFITANAGSNFPRERIRARGFGDTQPISDNKSEAGRSKNRRVEVLMLQN